MSKTAPSKSQPSAPRAERLAERLRDNLAKRKAQARARAKSAQEEAAAGPEPTAEGRTSRGKR